MPIPKSSSGEMPFLDHLEELRWRIIYSLIGIMIGLGVGLYCSFAFDLIGVIQAPVLPYLGGRHLALLHPMDGFTIHIQIAFVIALAIAAPLVLYQLWAFMAPALHKPEKRVIIPVLFGSVVLFTFGAAMAWFLVLPISLKWLYGINAGNLDAMYAASEYFSFATNMILAFGIAFQLPLLLIALSALGILSARVLNNSRKWAVLLIFIAAAVISPGDAITATIALAVPLYFLYEVSVVIAFVIEGRRRKRKEREERTDE
jgi:sec-independent protein translocase protein TatC